MMVGLPNLNTLMPTAKMKITNTSKSGSEPITVLYNPESYTQKRAVRYNSAGGLGQDGEVQQYGGGGNEELTFELFFDTFSSGIEAGGLLDGALLEANSLLPSNLKLDVRKYTQKVYELMQMEGDTHAPPILKIEWGSLQFKGILASCTQKFVKFSERGDPVRAILTVTFLEYLKPTDLAKSNPRNSPDTTKFRTVKQGDSLWAMAAEAYGNVGEWRRIADANEIANPRLLDSGSAVRIPAILR